MAKRETCDFKIEAGSELTLCALAKGHDGDHSPISVEVVREPQVEVVKRVEEFHVTVGKVDLIDWYNFCADQGVKPLYIELSNMGRQLMCSVTEKYLNKKAPNGLWSDFTDAVRDAFPEGRILREKLEVNVMREDERPLYYEAHIKIDGPMLRQFPMSSRDLLRVARWYTTKRSAHPFDAESFYRHIQKRIEHRAAQKLIGYEYEVCVRDTNPALDAGWAQ